MFGFQLSRDAEPAVLVVTGQVVNPDDRDVLKEAFAYVQPDDDLIVDLSELTDLDAGAASLLHEVLMRRAVIAESVVVSPREEVSMQLVLHDVDRVCPIVPTIEDATEILEPTWVTRRQPH
jgi:anti-anti-sigma regulatory factor